MMEHFDVKEGFDRLDFDKLESEKTIIRSRETESSGGRGRKAKTSPEKSHRMEMVAQVIKHRIDEDPTFLSKLGVLSPSLYVVNTLGFGDGGNIVVDPDIKDSRKYINTSAVVGYVVLNRGSETIEYATEVFSKDEVGNWIGTKVSRVLEPGQQVMLTRKYMTIFGCRPEIGFTFANGKMKRGSAIVAEGDIDGELEAHYFFFNDPNIKVNSDTVKLNVGTKVKTPEGEEHWVVKEKYEETFGYLNERIAKKKRRSYTAQNAAAAYVEELLKKSGQL